MSSPKFEDVEDIATLLDAPLSKEEGELRLAAAMRELDGEEFENLSNLIDWFQRRYPTPMDRFRYLRRKNAEARKRGISR